MVRILRSSVPSPLVVLSSKPIDPQICENVLFYSIKKGEKWNKEILKSYEKVTRVEAGGEFSLLGDTYFIYIKNTSFVIRVELFGDKIENISLMDNLSLRKERDLENVYVLSVNLPESGVQNIPEFQRIIDDINEQLYNSVFDYDLEKEPTEIQNFYLEKSLGFEDKYFALPIYVGKEKLWEMDLEKFINGNYKLEYYGQNVQAFKEKLGESIKKLTHLDKSNKHDFYNNAIFHEDNSSDRGFYSDSEKIVVITDQEIFGTLYFKSSIQNKNIGKLFNGEIKVGDYIVHDLHGVGIYRGIITQDVAGLQKDYLKIEYLDNDVLYVPYETVDKVSKFVGEGGEPKLTRLGSGEWESVRAKAKKDIEQIADELLDLYARRELEKGFSYDFDRAKEMYDQLISDFPYEDTPDQKRSTTEIIEDLKAEKPMDRLLVGDVGFGKTEVAVRAAFIAVLNHKQVIVLAPTTILVSQLYKVFVERLSKFGVSIAKVSRFEGDKKNKESLEKLAKGNLDIIIGTHRLLSADVTIKDMGLLIIDEEQRFGVKQKERIKSMKANLDVLSMSATPIPRTLQMSLSGIRDISVISTPPPGRLSVSTSLISKTDIYEPIKTEIERGGQVFIVHNNISTIYSLEEKIKEKVPNARTVVGHAKMTGDKLEKIMQQFADKEYDILIATTIIENGIDIPSVNTMIIDDAQNFGLSQLHQLRGRVGRSSTQAYCYLVVPYRLKNGQIDKSEQKKLLKEIENQDSEENTKKEKKEVTIDGIERIKAIIQHQSLGSGFHIASKDLEIRGSGSLLGASQSGHINSVGYDMYLRMLYQEIDRKKKEMKKMI